MVRPATGAGSVCAAMTKICGDTRTVRKTRTKNRKTVGDAMEGAVIKMAAVDMIRMAPTEAKY